MNARTASGISKSVSAPATYTAEDCFNCEFAWGIQCAAERGETSWRYEDRGWNLGQRNMPSLWRWLFALSQKSKLTQFGEQVLRYLKELGFTVEVQAQVIELGHPLLLVMVVCWNKSFQK